MTRILLYTGKGGVGKTSIAAATALLAAQRGHRTIVLSTDIAHSLADAFDMPLGPEPTLIAPNLWGQEPDVYHNIARYWATIQRYMADLFSWRGLDEVLAEEMTVLPGMDELGNLLWIADHVESNDYDVIVVDAAPTGETLRLLSLPEASRWWIERIAPIGRRVSRLGRPMLERVIGVPMPRDEVFAAAERLLQRLDKVHRLLADPEQSSVRIALALEKLSIVEAQRSFTYFHLFGYPSDLVVCNRVLPPGRDGDGSFESLRATQQRYLPEVIDQYAPVPVRTVPQFDREMIGLERLAEIGRALFGEDDPTSFFYRGRPYRVRAGDGEHVLEVALPFTTREDVKIARDGDELQLQVGALRRTIVLPRALMDAPTIGANMEDGVLQIRFRTQGDAKATRRSK
ncbi:MAG TPA: TRC40/GET3/ArsA family transport-energizing ATPase [Candidatus Limnocylindria bacterium]|nr:TRC40/GET3/ArsA family transport-energizing ATPase [Candidatus Limnocylindria bacterium]